MNPLAQLKDIQGLDHISVWPLAIGWWILGALILLGVVVTGAFYLALRKYRLRWEYRMLRRLEEMEATYSPDQAQELATELERLMRHVAIRRYSRDECAQLHGKEWLDWMTLKDPKKYDWNGSLSVLVEAPFQPPGASVDRESFKKTIQAAKGWVK